MNSILSLTILSISLGLGVAQSAAPAWFAKAKPLPAPKGQVIRVATAADLLAAVERVDAGGTILLADGEYKLPRVLVLSGKKAIAIRSDGGDPAKVVLSGKGWDSGAKGDDILHIGACDGVTIADLTFADCRSYGIKVEAENAPKDIQIYNCRFRDIGVRAIKGSAGKDPKVRAVKGSVRFCHFENTKVPSADWLFEGDYIAAIDMMALEDWTFSDNCFRNIKGRNGGGRAAIFIWVRSQNVIVERNFILNCDRGVAFGNPGQSTANTPGERLVYVANGIIRNNFITGGPDCGIELWYADNIKVQHNTIWRPERNWSRGIRVGTGTAQTDIANNLVHGEIRLEGGAAELRNNLARRLEGYFVDAASGDLALTVAATEAIGKGISIAEVTEDIRGRRRSAHPDIGAWELDREARAEDGSVDMPFGLESRVPWTTSRISGSPDPPLPYTVARTFTNLQWRAPLFVIAEPGTQSLLVIQQGGEKERPSKILRVLDDPATEQMETLLTVSNRLLYGVEFHPGYRTNGHLFVFSNGPTTQGERTNRISRFTVERNPAGKCDPDSERVIIEWRSAGHDGGGLVFGRDGMLYISTGDGTSDSDAWNSGQTVDDLLGGVLRINVDRVDATKAYSVPRDNPFVGMTNARAELWAYGLRNPWRMTVDQKTGHIWVGNNGQDLWETVHFLGRGENYGWSVYEGSHPFYLNRKLGPTPAIPPTIEHHHAEARSLTGGVVYYGDRLGDLNGAYIYGDYSSGTIWGARHDGSRLTWHKELARTELQIAAFTVSHRGELLIVDHTGGFYRLIESPKQTATTAAFPTRLSETGIFTSTKDHRVDAGVIAYSVNTPGWADGAHVERFIGLPGGTQISNGWVFPNGAVLMQTLSLASASNSPGRRIETRLFTRQQGQWAGYSYRWNESQSDATLVESKGAETEILAGDRRQLWRFPSRTECMACHSRAANFVLGFAELQLNKAHNYGVVRDEQLRTLQHVGLIAGTSYTKPSAKPKRAKATLVDPYDSSGDLETRARSYLHVNCSVCHMEAGGGNAKMELRASTKPEEMNIFDTRPQHDSFGINNAMLIAPGDPERSILHQRVSRRGRGQMPPLVSTVIDEQAVALLSQWIRGMKPTQTFVREWNMEDLAPKLQLAKNGRSVEFGRAAFRQIGCNQCHRFAGEGGTVGPDLTAISTRLSAHDLLESILLPSKLISEGYAIVEIETKSGELITGRVERENDSELLIRQSLASDAIVTVRKSDIQSRTLSKISNMPAGMLNTLTEAQILDLLAYLADSHAGAPANDTGGSVKPAPGSN